MMYLLLRDNKQTGPHSLDELKSMGLKAYDLVWLEGKSAAWRYPCEMDDLKSFAPPVEEQPFDRFFKKTASNPELESSELPSIVAYQPISLPSSPVLRTNEPKMPGRRVYVTMPAAKNGNPARETPLVREREISVTREVARVLPAAEPVYNFRKAIPDYTAEESFSPSSKEEMNLIERAPRKQRGSSRLLRPVAITLGLLTLLGTGILIGMYMNKAATPPSARTVQYPVTPDNQPVKTARQVPESAQTTPSPSTEPAAASVVPAATVEKNSTPVTQSPLPTPVKNKQTGGSAKQPVRTAVPVKDSAIANTTLPHREAIHRTDNTVAPSETSNIIDKEKEAIKNITSQVIIGTNGYMVGTFGGISDLQLTVSNHSTYPLDRVVVEVQYIQANKKVFKTENLYFRNIGPGSALMQEAPGSTRGIKVLYKISQIELKE